MKKNLFVFALLSYGCSLFSQSQVFTASGSFVVPPGATSMTVEVVGAGGSGGGNGTGGGGGGGYAKGVYAVTQGSTIPVIVGTPGGGSSAGTTAVGNLISATGGVNGVSVGNPSIGGGGAGGAGSGGTIVNRTGGNGGGGYYTYFGGGGGGAGGPAANGSNGGNTIAWTGQCMTPGGSGGAGGGAPGGSGGKGAGFTDINCNVTDPAGNGVNYGGGGGGGNGNGGGPGTGAGGYCIIFYGSCTAPAAPVNVTAAPNLTICSSQNTSLSASGTGTINWYSSSTSQTPIGTGTTFVTPALTGNTTYYIGATTCSNSPRTAVNVTVYPNPTVFALISPSMICAGNSATLAAGGASSYTWSTGSLGPITTVTPDPINPPPYDYTVVGIDNNGCTNSVVVTVTINPLPNINVAADSPSSCAGQIVNFIAAGATSYSWNGVAGSSSFTDSPNVTTTYTVSGTGTNTCRSQTVITITVTPNPSITISSSSPTVCINQKATLTASGGVTYSWSTGASTSTVLVTPSVSPITTYTVMGISNLGCASTATILQGVSSCAGIVFNGAETDGIKLYPVPNAGKFSIEILKDLELSFINSAGKKLGSYRLNAGVNNVDISSYPDGIYFLVGESDGAQIRQKIILSK